MAPETQDWSALLALVKILSATGGNRQGLNPQENDAIDKLECVLRHFFTCSRVSSLGVDAGALGRAHSYYLRLIVSKEKTGFAKLCREILARRFLLDRTCWSFMAEEAQGIDLADSQTP